MYKFITNTLGLGFDDRINKTSPIFVQWTYLHWFLQFLSPVALFLVESGHHTMAIMKYMSGLNIDSFSPHSLPTCVDQQEMPISLPEHGFAQTCYSVHISDIKIPSSDLFSKEHVNELYKFSKMIKMRQKTRVVSKWLNSLRDIISNANNF